MKALVIWQAIPESTTAYQVEVDEDQAAKLRKAHDVYINLYNGDDEDAAIEWVNEMVDTEWVEAVVEGPIESKPDLVIFCGFIM